MTKHSASDNAVAIIGMSCRFAPDLSTLDRFWEFLSAGRSAVGAMPEKRWKPYAAANPQATAIMRETTLLGSYLDDIEGFDAEFFGISPREADFLDPQQRFMLELAWEALSNAGVAPLSLRGGDIGVWVAANSNDYGRRLLEDIPGTGAYAVNGTTFYGIANRLSYFLDLRGPSIAVDTACAGSLTALHLATQSLRDGETPMAIVGGLNVMATPALNVALQACGALAPDGRSKAFDKGADGYGRGEGAGVVVLKRLADARRDGDPVLAVVLGGGVFQDGRSDGMMAPNADAQEHMLRQAYARIGISPASVDYVEAHGTGTPTGDGMEIAALSRVFGAGRAPADPCLIGSVKPNIGHVEGGSGIAGVIKTVLALQHEQLPPSLHEVPTPAVDWENSGLRLVGEPTPWRTNGHPRRAGVSSYGVGGTIAHVVLQESPVPAEVPTADAAPRRRAVYPVSAMSEAGLRALSGSVADWLDADPRLPISSAGYTLARRRSHLSHRAAVVAEDRDELVSRLRALADGQTVPGAVTGRTTPGHQEGVVWVFSGHGAQWSGMGRSLLAESRVFAAAVDGLADVYQEELGWTPRHALTSGGPWTAGHVQALTFAVQIGLAELWRSHGLRPAAVIGHSVGEIAAAVVAGSLDPREAARFACRRAAALQRLEGLGRMAMVSLPFEQARDRLGERTDVEAAISASPHATVVSGDAAAIEALAEQWSAAGIEVRMVDSDIAFHSRHVDVVTAEVAAAAAALAPRRPLMTLYSTALADPRSTVARDQRYWATNLREPVRFAEAVDAALADGHRLFVEVSAHPVVTHSIREAAHERALDDVAVVPTLVRNADELATLLANLGTLHCNGAEIDWSYNHATGALLPAPAAAWQHRPYWIFDDDATSGLGGGHDPASHSLLGGRMTVSGAPSRQVWQTYLDVASRPYPLYHGLVGVEVTPAASILNTFAQAAGSPEAPSLTDIVLRTPLAVQPPRVVQIVREGRALALATRVAGDSSPDAEDAWLTHTTANIDAGSPPPSGHVDADALRARLAEGSPARVGEMFERMGVGGYAFPWEMVELRRDDQEQLAVLDIVPPPATTATSWAHVIDGALTISAVVVAPGDATTLWMSKSIERVAFRGDPPARILVHSKRSPRSPLDTVDVWVADESGDVLCVCTGLRFAAVEHLGTAALPRELVHEVVWKPVEVQPRADAVQQAVLLGDPDACAALAAQWEAGGVPCTVLDGEPTEQQDVVALTPQLLARPGAVVVVPSLARSGEPLERSAERAAWTVLRTAQRLAELADSVAPQRIWAVTRGVRRAADERSVAHGPLWGLGRITAGEHPEFWGGVVDLDDVTDLPDGPLLDVLGALAGQEDVVSLTAGGAAVARLAQLERPADGSPMQCSPSGTVLITGGLGALGLEVARWLVEQGARRFVLTSRRGLPPRGEWPAVTDPAVRSRIDGVLALEALGVTVAAVALDVTDAEQVAKTLAPGALGLPPVTGIVHAAGVVNDALVDNVDLAGLRDVLAPKANGAMVLHRLFPPGSLDFFVLFSSCGQFARLSGQASYAAANSFLDALATHRNAGGGTETRSLGWTAWRGVGLSADIGTTMLEANSRGLEAVSVAEAFRAWSFGDRFRADYQAVLRVLPGTARPPMLRDLTAGEDGEREQGALFGIDFDALSEQEAVQRIVADVRDQVAAELNLDPVDVELKRPLVELGVDSVMTVALRVRLQRRYGLDLPPTILWARPTVAALAEHVTEGLRP